MQNRASHVARGWIAGSFATGIAAVSHGLAHGSAPSALAIFLGLVFAGMLGTLAIGRRASLPRLTLVVAGSQGAFHLVFSWLSPVATTVVAAHQTAGHHATAQFGAAHVGHLAHTDAAMWVAHALAAAATIAFLRRAEHGLWQVLRDTFHRVASRLPAIEARPALSRIVSANAPRHPLPLFLSVVTTRGPPRLGFTS
ncbi:MAG: hypothetical protein ABIR17_09345 [Pseudolysinimonas sp.]|uniref:hypothetical protein n=1 Tax=Pseudolysinimonas sp. TaxID=2680009 RepID=UPI003265272E